MTVSFHPSMDKPQRMPSKARQTINSTGGRWDPNRKPLDTIAAAKARALRAVVLCESEPKLTVLEMSFYRKLRNEDIHLKMAS